MTSVNTTEPLYEISGLRRRYPLGSSVVTALDGVDLVLDAGEMVAIEGTSGSGKSTLLAVLGGLDRPTEGVVRFEGTDLGLMSDGELTSVRARQIGFVFQGFNLIPTLSATLNVEAVMGPLGLSRSQQRARALELLDRVGLSARADHLPSRLSGGEQQRVAIARALANGPRVVLADEPTGNLDSRTAAEVMDLLRALGTDTGVTVVLVTHDREVAAQASRRIVMRDGLVVSDSSARAVSAVPTELAQVIELDRRLVAPAGWTAARARRLSVALVAQAAAVVATAGVGAAVLLPHTTPSASTSCSTSCHAALAPSRVPVRVPVERPSTAAPTPVPAVHVQPKPAAPAPSTAPVFVVPVARSVALPRPATTRAATTTSSKPLSRPVVAPPVTAPKPVVPVVRPTVAPTQAPTDPTTTTAAALPVWSQWFSWLTGSAVPTPWGLRTGTRP